MKRSGEGRAKRSIEKGVSQVEGKRRKRVNEEGDMGASGSAPVEVKTEALPNEEIKSEASSPAKEPKTPTKSGNDTAAKASGGGKGKPRIRFPDRLNKCLDDGLTPDVIWWHEDGEGFAFDSTTVQERFLNEHFETTKLKSFIRSLNRWGFRRIFYPNLPKTVFSFQHPKFKRGQHEMRNSMKMISFSGQQTADMEEFRRQQEEEAAARAAAEERNEVSTTAAEECRAREAAAMAAEAARRQNALAQRGGASLSSQQSGARRLQAAFQPQLMPQTLLSPASIMPIPDVASISSSQELSRLQRQQMFGMAQESQLGLSQQDGLLPRLHQQRQSQLGYSQLRHPRQGSFLLGQNNVGISQQRQLQQGMLGPLQEPRSLLQLQRGLAQQSRQVVSQPRLAGLAQQPLSNLSTLTDESLLLQGMMGPTSRQQVQNQQQRQQQLLQMQRVQQHQVLPGARPIHPNQLDRLRQGQIGSQQQHQAREMPRFVRGRASLPGMPNLPGQGSTHTRRPQEQVSSQRSDETLNLVGSEHIYYSSPVGRDLALNRLLLSNRVGRHRDQQQQQQQHVFRVQEEKDGRQEERNEGRANEQNDDI